MSIAGGIAVAVVAAMIVATAGIVMSSEVLIHRLLICNSN